MYQWFIPNTSPDQDRFESGVEWSEDSRNYEDSMKMQQLTSSFVALPAKFIKDHDMLKALSSLGPYLQSGGLDSD